MKTASKKAEEKITLKIGAKSVASDVFLKAVESFLALIYSVSEDVAGKAKAIRWKISVKSGSALITASPEPKPGYARAAKASIHAVVSGIDKIQSGKLSYPTHFSKSSLEAARQLAYISTRFPNQKQGISILNGTSNTKRGPLSDKALETLDDLIGPRHEAVGSIEGRLETLSVARGNCRFIVYESVTEEPVDCKIEDKGLLAQAHAAFNKRVVVRGLVKYRKDGKPSSIEAENIKAFKDEEELPTIEEMEGIFLR